MEITDKTIDLLNKGEIDNAIQFLELSIKESNNPKDDLYYLLGNAYRKKGNWQYAINNYLEAIAINPNSPAKQAYEMAMSILNFYNKDMYNQ
ncbi:MAG: tetratricopeptide repeat protein [Bacteroidaceae bacterium]|nr:tetratricopeptide repeat protein [Bacteroidaceae bacterium]